MPAPMTRSFDRPSTQIADALVAALQADGFTVSVQGALADEIETHQLTATDPSLAERAAAIDVTSSVAAVQIAVRATGVEASEVSLIDPIDTATLTDEPDLLEPAAQLRDRVAAVLERVASTPSPQETGGADVEKEVRRDLLGAIARTVHALDADEDPANRAETLFVLAKAYTAIVSLDRTEEIELHLA